MNVAQTIDRLRADTNFCPNLAKWHTIPPREARFAPFPEAMHPDLVAGMKKRGYTTRVVACSSLAGMVSSLISTFTSSAFRKRKRRSME